MAQRVVIVLLFVMGAGLAFAQTPSKISPKSPLPTQFDSTQSVAELRKDLDEMFTTKAYRNSSVGVKVVRLRTGETIYERNANEPLTPASNTKLFSTNAAFFALRNLGMLTTEVRMTGKIAPDGTLNGDLYIIGKGDAMLSVNDIEEIADKLFAIGMRKLNGSVYADPSFFDNETNRAIYSGDFEDVQRLAPVMALSYSMGSIAVVVSATSKGYISIQTIPQSDAFVLDKNTKRSTRKRRIRVSSTVGKDGRQTISVSGSPGANRTSTVYVDMRNPALALAGSLSNRLRSGGVENDAKIGVKPAPSNARVVASFSRDFVSLASVVNKRSHNYLAEHVFKIVGGYYGGKPSTAEKAQEMILSVLDSMGVDREGAVFNDGSGLSRRNLVSAHTVVELLKRIRSMPYAAEFYESLSIAGVDGTLRGRMHGTAAENNMRGKTGTLRNVSSLSGYVTTADGELWAFSVLSNGPYKRNFKSTEDHVAVRLADFSYKDGGKKSVVPDASDEADEEESFDDAKTGK